MAGDNNCPLCGQTVGQLAYALAGKAEVCVKHRVAAPIEIHPESSHPIAGRGIVHTLRNPFADGVNPVGQKVVLEGVVREIRSVEYAGMLSKGSAIGVILTPIAATQPPIGGK